MGIPLKLLTVLALAAFHLWAAVPAGFVLKLHPLAVGSAGATGAILGTLAVVLCGARVRMWYAQHHAGDRERQSHPMVTRVWQRYGVVGLGLLAPWITGAPLGAALGLAFGASAGRLLLWTSIGAVLCAILLTLACALGLSGLESLLS
jgi:hypothetical protein